MRNPLSILAACAACTALAAAEVPGLLPTPLARPLLEQDPAVTAARSSLEAARLEAGILERSPYEWTARVTSQRRSLDAGPRYNEWNAAIERPWRLPGKASADGELAKATVAEAEARYGEAIQASARELATLWLEALAAERALELADAIGTAAQENLDAVDKRVRAGDASRLDASIARGELAEQHRLAAEARTQAVVARAKMQARFPGLRAFPAALPDPLALPAPASFYRERILAQSDEIKVAEAQLDRARAHAQRASAERFPDPTLGVFTASEVGGQERLVGVTVSIPLPGGLRSKRAEKAVHSVEAARHEAAGARRRIESEIAVALATAEGSYAGSRIAEEGAVALQENARLVQRAYALGESDLQSLLAARRQAALAAQNALSARIAALKAHYLVLVDAHLVWDLDKDQL